MRKGQRRHRLPGRRAKRRLRPRWRGGLVEAPLLLSQRKSEQSESEQSIDADRKARCVIVMRSRREQDLAPDLARRPRLDRSSFHGWHITLVHRYLLPTGTSRGMLLWEGLVHSILRVMCVCLVKHEMSWFNSAADSISADAREKVARVGFWLCVRDGQRSSM